MGHTQGINWSAIPIYLTIGSVHIEGEACADFDTALASALLLCALWQISDARGLHLQTCVAHRNHLCLCCWTAFCASRQKGVLHTCAMVAFSLKAFQQPWFLALLLCASVQSTRSPSPWRKDVVRSPTALVWAEEIWEQVHLVPSCGVYIAYC